jgi:phage recombination protein Bet
MSTGLAVAVRETSALAMWSPEQIEVIKDLICPGASDTELELFGQVCRRTGLDPFARQIYGLMRWDGRAKKNKLSIQTSIDGFRLTAERTGKYAGQLGPQWCGPDGVWRDVWLESDFPAAARVGVLRSDWREPMWSVARWDSYVQKFKNKDNGGEFVGEMWKRMPDVMIAKCAESLGLRRAFPAELSGLYTAEEMAQAGGHEPPPIEEDDALRRADAAMRRAEEAYASEDRAEDATTPIQDVGEQLRQHAVRRAKQLAEHAKAIGHPDAERIILGVPETMNPRTLRAWVEKLEAAFPDVEDPDEVAF